MCKSVLSNFVHVAQVNAVICVCVCVCVCVWCTQYYSESGLVENLLCLIVFNLLVSEDWRKWTASIHSVGLWLLHCFLISCITWFDSRHYCHLSAFLLCVQKAYITNIGPRTGYSWGTFCGVLESFLAYVSVMSCVGPWLLHPHLTFDFSVTIISFDDVWIIWAVKSVKIIHK